MKKKLRFVRMLDCTRVVGVYVFSLLGVLLARLARGKNSFRSFQRRRCVCAQREGRATEQMDGVGEVTAFLTKLGLEQCVQAVVHNGFYTSMEALRGATYEEAPSHTQPVPVPRATHACRTFWPLHGPLARTCSRRHLSVHRPLSPPRLSWSTLASGPATPS